jgi:GNAT superfamily N-acetyltransferase
MMDAAPVDVRFIRARGESLAAINELIARSKAHWNWPDGYLDSALALHRIGLTYLRGNHCFEALNASDDLIAFVSVIEGDARVVLDNLWVTPELIGHRVGRRACEHVFRVAQEKRWAELWVLPDPPAAGFYVKMGFSDTGERVPSRVPGGPIFAAYRIRLEDSSRLS